MQTIGQRLKAERKRLGYDLGGFAALGGVGRSTQANYEADSTQPSSAYLNKIGAAGAEIFWIMRGAEEDDALREKTQPTYPPEVRELIADYLRCAEEIQKSIRLLAAAAKIK